MRSARSSQIASNPALCPPDTTSFGNVAAAKLRQRQLVVPDRPPAAEHGNQRHDTSDHFGRQPVGATPHCLQKTVDPVFIRQILIPEGSNLVYKHSRGWNVLVQGECSRLQ